MIIVYIFTQGSAQLHVDEVFHAYTCAMNK